MIGTMIRTAFLAVLPVIGHATCRDGHQVMSGAQGTGLGPATQSCIEPVAGQ